MVRERAVPWEGTRRLIRAEGLSKQFAGPRGSTVEAVRGVSFEVAPGEVFGLLGPNGAGKTTLLRMLATILTPSAGDCWVDGLRVRDAPDAVRRNIGFLSGNTKLYGRLTGEEVLRYFGRLYGMEEQAITARISVLTEWLDMGAFIRRRIDALSTGQTQRVSIARVVLHEPKVLILDEPTLGLDILTSSSIIEFVKTARENGHSIIYSTHYLGEAEQLCDRIGLIHEGSFLTVGTQAEIYARTGSTNLHDAFLALVGQGAEVAA